MVADVFEPADYSLQELAFLLAHVDETPNVALHGTLPPGVNKTQVKDALQRFSELAELEKIKKVPWAGHDAIRDSIDRFIAWHEQSLEIQAQGGPRWPSMYNWDSTGAMYRGGIGSDAVEKVRHEILGDGTRKPFAVNLRDVGTQRVNMPWVKGAAKTQDVMTHKDGGYHCSVCQKLVASYDVDGGRKAQNKARTEAVKHCRTAKKEIARHRAIAAMTIE